MRIVFMGTPSYAKVILEEILKNNFEVVGVFTQPDKPVSRKKILTPPDVKKFILEKELEIPIFQPKTLRDEKAYQDILNLKPDFIIVAAYGQILPKNILDIAPCINLHASILPRYRGASPIQSAILAGEKETGITAMLMDVGLDDGDMLAFSYLNIKGLNADEVFDKLSVLAAKLTIKVLNEFESLKPIKQDESLVTKCTKIKKEDGLVKFNDNAKQVMRKFRAFKPWPGIFLENGTKLLDIKLKEGKKTENLGEITAIDKVSFSVQFKDGEVEIFELQEPSKKPILARDFINGKRLKVGDRIY
ncbi:10-formyltetrahydrofolate:L-methionyl-tRNA(fMet) N-formyltransferase [Campylobacter blaseri]|uniref:Methionyl-tRNA formyltransferase n=1 Tax=Campylobacter blaseri TaxID=2042961 RepID=A0A2P8QZD2_9BACT|nr:methionyl-tRNA formyltransferase [Campylobacter blaseri]PSM51607.1 methionyl-tRNA formyltransferase [Campylobacter blaseri]PSM53400.1 methionyl-tRNA formyltransferase [Campylobacter blaseri]QKF86696.1 10-formyltetrahydrofolate:L-methionyl-tRNA(fMet) N-formyltransferase [Campylobacter blaseri]